MKGYCIVPGRIVNVIRKAQYELVKLRSGGWRGKSVKLKLIPFTVLHIGIQVVVPMIH